MTFPNRQSQASEQATDRRKAPFELTEYLSTHADIAAPVATLWPMFLDMNRWYTDYHKEGAGCIGSIDEILAIAHVMIGWFGRSTHSDACELKPKAGDSRVQTEACATWLKATWRGLTGSSAQTAKQRLQTFGLSPGATASSWQAVIGAGAST